MGKKDKGKAPKIGSLVFTTGTEGNSFFDDIRVEETHGDELAPQSLNLRVYRDKKMRRGKVATIVTGWRGNLNTLKELGKELKVACGVGGSVKDNEILIQGDFRDKVVDLLKEKGYTGTKPTGG
ncbi:translation initiation factor [Portibacter marinus]|uniref:translation initiation factor n=1 Tax=Portibacter marinus TaxID=2898660 RepID=UPI001F45C24E|nr:translation initiation factor [Portibacter marinus]